MKILSSFLQGRTLIMLLLSVSFFLLFSCKKEIQQTEQSMRQNESDDAIIATKVVQSGSSIQSAIDAAEAGAVIKIEPGVYKEAIKISKANITIIGISKAGEDVVIENPGDEENGVTVTNEGDGFKLKNVIIKGFEENGVLLIHVDGFVISRVTAINNGEYGIFPVFCSNGVVEFCIASGHSDTGLYIGQSSDVEIRFNDAHANVNGIEVENSHRVNVHHNKTYDNVAGMLLDVLPGKTIKSSSDVNVMFNYVANNNHENFGEEGSLESVVPSGIGILNLGTDKAVIEKNVIEGNKFLGITLFSTLVLGQLAGIPPDAFNDIEPNPDDNRISNNLLVNNGYNPPQLSIPLPGVDLLWDGSGTNNCWSGNIFKTSYPSLLPSCN